MITSRDNPTVKLARRLSADAGLRRRERLFFIEGARLCADAARSGVALRTALYTPQAAEAYPAPLEELRAAGAEMTVIDEAVAARLGDTVHPQGVFCIAEWLPSTALDIAEGLDRIIRRASAAPRFRALALERLQDPSNIGAVIRTAEAFGLDAVLLSDGCADIYNPKVLRASMGGVFRLSLLPAGDMAAAARSMEDAGIACFACVADGEAAPLGGVDFPARCAALIGNEGAGLLPETAAACRRLTIPMAGRAQSLNAAVAAGIVAYVMTRPDGGA